MASVNGCPPFLTWVVAGGSVCRSCPVDGPPALLSLFLSVTVTAALTVTSQMKKTGFSELVMLSLAQASPARAGAEGLRLAPKPLYC